MIPKEFRSKGKPEKRRFVTSFKDSGTCFTVYCYEDPQNDDAPTYEVIEEVVITEASKAGILHE